MATLLTFKQFLIEKWRLYRNVPKHADQEGGHQFANRHKIGNDIVDVEFASDSYGDKNYHLDYTVNKAWDKDAAKATSDPKAIFKHVHSKIHQFMRKAKPKSVRFSAYSKASEPMYDQLANHLAKKYGGTVERVAEPSYRGNMAKYNVKFKDE